MYSKMYFKKFREGILEFFLKQVIWKLL